MSYGTRLVITASICAFVLLIGVSIDTCSVKQKTIETVTYTLPQTRAAMRRCVMDGGSPLTETVWTKWPSEAPRVPKYYVVYCRMGKH